MARPTGSRNAILTKKDRGALLKQLKTQALSGDCNAITAVMLLDQSLRQQKPRASE